MGQEIKRAAEICNSKGLHARAAAKFCKTAEPFDADIKVSRSGVEVSACSIMGLLLLAAAPGSVIEIRASGPEAGKAIDTLCALVANKFDEE